MRAVSKYSLFESRFFTGGELYTYMEREGMFSEPTALFDLERGKHS